MSNILKNKNILIITFITFIILCLYIANTFQKQNTITKPNHYLTEQSTKIIYLKKGDESSTTGEGTESSPYQSIKYAIEKSSNGDTIKLLEDIVYRQPSSNINFIINKNITIDGNDKTLTFRGSNLELLANVEFKNITLNIIPDGSSTTKIYVSGNEVTFNNVSTLINQIQYDERPTIIGGAKSGSSSGNHTKINIINGSSETRFKEIIIGKENSNSSLPATINISSEFSKIDNGINLGGSGNYKVTGKVIVATNSKNINKIDGTNSTNNTVVIKDSKIYNMELINIANLILKDRASLTLDNLHKLSGDIELEDNTSLWINTIGQLEINNLLGKGELILSTDTNLQVNKNILDSANIKINGYESSLKKNINKVYVEVFGTINQNTKVLLYNEKNNYLINKENNKYRLIENNGFDKNSIKKIDIHQKPDKISYKVGENIDLTNLILKLTDKNNNTMLVDYTNLNNYKITYSPTTKLTTGDTTLTIKLDSIKATIPIEVKENSKTEKPEEEYKKEEPKKEEIKDITEEVKNDKEDPKKEEIKKEDNSEENREEKPDNNLNVPKEDKNNQLEEVVSEETEANEKEEIKNEESLRVKENRNYLSLFLVISSILILTILTITYVVKKRKNTKIL